VALPDIMRTRYRITGEVLGDIGPQTHLKSVRTGGSWPAYVNQGGISLLSQKVVLSRTTESISDSSGARRSNLCHHTICKETRNSPSEIEYEIRADDSVPTDGDQRWKLSGAGAFWYETNWVYNWGTITPENISIIYPEPLSSSVRRAMHQFHNLNEVNTLLNVVESPDFISGLRSIVSRQDKLGRRRLQKGALSGSYLYWAFGIAPLIGDMKKVRKAMKTIKADMDRRLRAMNGDHVVHYKVMGSFDSFNPAPVGLGPDTNNSGSWWHSSFIATKPPSRIVTCRGTWAAKYNTKLFQTLDYFMSRFFSAGPVSYGWERLPFSFVADWFVDLSNVLDNLDQLFTGSNSTIKDIVWSESYKALCPMYKHKRRCFLDGLDGQQVGINELTYYHREPLMVPPLSVGLSGRFGKKQGSIAAALLHQIVAKRQR